MKDLGESGWLRWLGRLLRGHSHVAVSFGDDTACLKPSGRPQLLTVDLLIEGTHFTWRTATPASLGEKLVAVSVSDIAAMGGVARAMVVGLATPADMKADRLKSLFRSIEKSARRWNVAFVGGDSVRSEQLVLASVILGEFEGPIEALPLRSRMRPGHNIYVTGTLGDSAAGLAILQGEAGRAKSWSRHLVERHRRPKPRVREAQALAQGLPDVAMIDLSDDLARSVELLCQSSGVGAEIRTDRLPVSPQLRAYCRASGREALDLAVGGGEDFELLFSTAAGPRRIAQILRKIRAPAQVRLIGRAVRRGGVRWTDHAGRTVKVAPKRFEHFGR